jgi:hypothetical protein
MKKIILILLIFALPFWANAEQLCEWTGTTVGNCVNLISGGVVYLPNRAIPIKDPEVLRERGYYPVIVTDPVMGENQIRDQVVWDVPDPPGDAITKTWTVRDLTTTEIDQNTAAIMSHDIYALWRVLFWKGIITQQEAATILPQEMIDAYQARDRLENP